MSISKRTVYLDDTNGIKRFWDFAIVQTTLGRMVEPFRVNERIGNAPIIEFDATDMMARIDDIEYKPIDIQQRILSGDENQHIHGGFTLTRTGR